MRRIAQREPAQCSTDVRAAHQSCRSPVLRPWSTSRHYPHCSLASRALHPSPQSIRQRNQLIATPAHAPWAPLPPCECRPRIAPATNRTQQVIPPPHATKAHHLQQSALCSAYPSFGVVFPVRCRCDRKDTQSAAAAEQLCRLVARRERCFGLYSPCSVSVASPNPPGAGTASLNSTMSSASA